MNFLAPQIFSRSLGDSPRQRPMAQLFGFNHLPTTGVFWWFLGIKSFQKAPVRVLVVLLSL